MNDTALQRLLAAPGETSRQLTARAARLALAVADVVEGSASSESGAVHAVSFLRDWASSASAVLPGAPQPLDLLADHYQLCPAEVELLLLAGLAEEHEGLASTIRALHPRGDPRPSVGLAALVLGRSGFHRAELRELLSTGRAIRFRLLQVAGPGALFFERSLVLADQLWEALHALDAFPADLGRVTIPAPPPGLDDWLAEPAIRHAARIVRDGVPVTLLVHAREEAISLSRCAALAASVGARLLAARIRPSNAPAIALLAVHAAARSAVPMVVASAPFDAEGGSDDLEVRDLPGPVIVVAGTSRGLHLSPYRPVVTVPVGPVAVAQRRAAWLVGLPRLSRAEAADLAARHPLDPALIAPVVLDAQVGADYFDPRTASGLIRARAAVSLPPGVELVTPTVPWSRLVLPEEAGFQLRDAVARLRHQALVIDDWRMGDYARAARGIRLLFTGLPGTGKSLAAEAVARAAATDLLRVDVSQVVSKWLGETEKNLASVFDVAERCQAVLLLDEADALFGARTQITDAHDRYANLETAYLLQRLDHFEGLAVLTTNLRHNIDPAFTRRMDSVVDFALPDLARRRELWQLHLPPDRMAEDVDIDALARLYPVAGGWIRNAAITAAFSAAPGGDRIAQHHLVAAVRREYLNAALPFPGEPPRRRDDT
jgi:hypothetical protein